MAMTGDWTVVKSDGDGDGDPSSEPMETIETESREEAQPQPQAQPQASSSSADPSLQPARKKKKKKKRKAAVRFPCMEQPPRFALRSSKTGVYLGGSKKGRLVGRNHRSEKDEWTIAIVEEGKGRRVSSQGYGNGSGSIADTTTTTATTTTTVVTIHNQKFGNILSMVLSEKSDLGRTVACVSPHKPNQTTRTSNNNNEGGGGGATPKIKTVPNQHDLGLGEEEEEDEFPQEQLPDDEDDEHLTTDAVLSSMEDPDVLQWNVIRCNTTNDDDTFSNNNSNSNSNNNNNGGGIVIVSRKTGDCLSVSESGRIILSPYEPFHVWQMECVTGELCFLSNPSFDARVRCDMAGILTLSPNWKGWEVVRITEATTNFGGESCAGKNGTGNNKNNNNNDNDDGSVRISSWMHSQWFLCSDETGTVSTCSVSESLLPAPSESEYEQSAVQETNDTNTINTTNLYRCSKWVIEKHNNNNDGQQQQQQQQRNSKHDGLIIRSVTHGRVLSIRDGFLRTYDSLDDAISSETESSTTLPTRGGDAAANSSIANIGDLVKQKTGAMKRTMGSSEWWRQSVLTNVQKSFSESSIQRRNNSKMLGGDNSNSNNNAVLERSEAVAQKDTLVWQLEAAHLQTYYFVSNNSSNSIHDDAEESGSNSTCSVPRSIGAFPCVTDNLRKSDKIQLVRNDDDQFDDALKLYLPDDQFYVTCSSKGSILATKQTDDEGTEWILEEQTDGSSVFRSKAHGLYLSFEANHKNKDSSEQATPPAAAFAAMSEASSTNDPGNNTKKKTNNNNPLEHLQQQFRQHVSKPKKNIVLELCATPKPTTTWNLQPCTPRAISSKRLSTFAIGTSIAIGTTIAMPFALAGVAAAMGALGAEAGIGFGIVAAAATGAEALVSVGAIGATAYFCFRPEHNSLGGKNNDEKESDDDDENENKPCSKRPFGNWRNW